MLGMGVRRWTAVLVGVASMIGVAPTAGADRVTAAADAQFTDPVGDTYGGFTGIPMEECHADIEHFGARYVAPEIQLWTVTVCGFDPFTSPHWSTPFGGLIWNVDLTGDGAAERRIVMYRKSGVLVVEVFAGSETVCTGTPGWDGGRRFTATIQESCVGTPSSIRFQAFQLWDNSPYNGATLQPMDEAPNGGMTAPVARTHPVLPAFDGPGAASAGAGEIDVFARGQDDGLYVRHLESGAWGPWQGLGGIVTSAPSAASPSADLVNVFARGQDGALWSRHFDGGSWGPWFSLGGVLSTAPAVVSRSAGTFDVFAAGGDQALWARHFDGTTWGAWYPLGGIVTAPPAAASSSPGTLVVFGRGQDDALWMRSLDGSWGGWESLGGVITTAPGAASRAPGSVDVFARGNDNALWTRHFDGGWTSWSSLGGIVLSPPEAVSHSVGVLDVFARGQDGALWANHDDGSGFAGWYTLGGIIK